MVTGYDNGDEENCWSYASGLSTNSDYDFLTLQILSLDLDDYSDPNLFFGDITFELFGLTENGQGATMARDQFSLK